MPFGLVCAAMPKKLQIPGPSSGGGGAHHLAAVVVHITQTLQLLTAMVNGGLSPDVTTPRTLRLGIAGAGEHLAALTRELDEHDARAVAVRLDRHSRQRKKNLAKEKRMRQLRIDDRLPAEHSGDENDSGTDEHSGVIEYAPLGGRGPPPPPGGGGVRKTIKK